MGPRRRPSLRLGLQQHPPICALTADETLLKDTVRRFAVERLQPKVREMDANQKLDLGLLKGHAPAECGRPRFGAERCAVRRTVRLRPYGH